MEFKPPVAAGWLGPLLERIELVVKRLVFGRENVEVPTEGVLVEAIPKRLKGFKSLSVPVLLFGGSVREDSVVDEEGIPAVVADVVSAVV